MPGSTRLGLVGGGTISPGQVVLASVAIPGVSATARAQMQRMLRMVRQVGLRLPLLPQLLLDPPQSPKPKRSDVSTCCSASSTCSCLRALRGDG